MVSRVLFEFKIFIDLVLLSNFKLVPRTITRKIVIKVLVRINLSYLTVLHIQGWMIGFDSFGRAQKGFVFCWIKSYKPSGSPSG